MAEKFALITGGSSGIGLEFAHLLGQRGYALLLVSNQAETLEQLRHDLTQRYTVRVEVYCLDLSYHWAAQDVFDHCQKQQFHIEILINNAGFFFFGQAVDADDHKAIDMMTLHMITTARLCSLFGRQMRERKQGYILNTSSISAYKAFPGISYYGSTKAFIKSFTRSLHTELKMYGVHVTCLSPGATATNLYDPNVIDVEMGKKFGIMMDARQVAQAGLNGLFKNKASVIPGFTTKAMLFLALLTPQWVIYQLRLRVKWLK